MSQSFVGAAKHLYEANLFDEAPAEAVRSTRRRLVRTGKLPEIAEYHEAAKLASGKPHLCDAVEAFLAQHGDFVNDNKVVLSKNRERFVLLALSGIGLNQWLRNGMIISYTMGIA